MKKYEIKEYGIEPVESVESCKDEVEQIRSQDFVCSRQTCPIDGEYASKCKVKGCAIIVYDEAREHIRQAIYKALAYAEIMKDEEARVRIRELLGLSNWLLPYRDGDSFEGEDERDELLMRNLDHKIRLKVIMGMLQEELDSDDRIHKD